MINFLRSWNFKSRLHTDILGAHSISIDEKENFACWAPPNPSGTSSFSSCSFCQFQNSLFSSSKWKHFDCLLSVFFSPRTGQSTPWSHCSLTLNWLQFPAAWQATQIFHGTRAMQIAVPGLGTIGWEWTTEDTLLSLQWEKMAILHQLLSPAIWTNVLLQVEASCTSRRPSTSKCSKKTRPVPKHVALCK